jgi:hypothetical protein
MISKLVALFLILMAPALVLLAAGQAERQSATQSSPAVQPQTGILQKEARVWIPLAGAFVGMIGGIAGLVSALRPPKIVAAHTDHLGIVVSQDRSTSELHLPLVLSNTAKKPGVVTSLLLSVRPVNGTSSYLYEWAVFWKEDGQGKRVRERQRSPIPIPGYTCIERNVGFACANGMVWKSQTYQCELTVKVGRGRARKRVSRFYARPSEARCKAWYEGQPLASSVVDDLPIFSKEGGVPADGL